MASYRYVRERPNPEAFHLVADDMAGRWRPSAVGVVAIRGRRLVDQRADGTWDAQYEGDMIGWPPCPDCVRRVDPTIRAAAGGR
jgi:hypothetical protein